MINAATIMKHTMEWLQDDHNMKGAIFSRSEFVNEDPSQALNGWVGLYRRSVDYEPRNLGRPTDNYEGDLTFDIVVQKTAMGSGADAEDALESCVKFVLDRLIQIPKTYLNHFAEIIVEYTYLETDRKTMYFQGALITVTAEFSISTE